MPYNEAAPLENLAGQRSRMNRTQLIVRNLRYHARGNLAVLLGAVVGAAVLTGALLVGDSLRGSLRARAERQLGNIDAALVGPRFMRAEIADQLPGQVRGCILLQGTVHAGAPEDERRAGKVSVWGVNRRFGIDIPALAGKEPVAILSANLAKALDARVGDSIFVGVQKSGDTPRASLVGKRGITDTTRTFKLTVTHVLPEADKNNALSLSITPTLPLNLFIPLGLLQQEIGKQGKINTILVSGQSAQTLQSELQKRLTLEDWDLTVRVAEFRNRYLNLSSPRLLLEPAVVDAATRTAGKMGLRSAKTYTYLANSIIHGDQVIPYAIVAALDPTEKTPLGPFLPEGVTALKENDIVLVDWKQSPIKIEAGEKEPKITLEYFDPEVEGQIRESKHAFNYRGTIPLDGPANDRDLTPQIKGITDALELDDWDPPFEIKQNRFMPRDKAYWKQYRTAPKAYIRLEDGQKLWGSRFGNVTTVRVTLLPTAVAAVVGTAADEAIQPAIREKTRSAFEDNLLLELDPVAGGFVFQPIRERMLDAGKGSTDFGMLFLSFSFFLIVAALMLVGLLFRLNLDRRASEIGLLRATGFPARTVRRILLVEGLIVATIGSLLGIAGAFAYADLMINLLVSLWPTPGVDSYLRLHATTASVAIGFLSSVLMSGLAIVWALRSLNKVEPANLLKGNTTPADHAARGLRRSPWPIRIAGVALFCAIVLGLSGPFMPPGEPRAGTFFGSGALLLTAGLSLLWAWLKKSHHAIVAGHGAMALVRLGSRNAVRNPTRSILTAGLLASAAFLLVAVESFRREPEKDFLQKDGGSGGFPLIAESATPIDFDLNDPAGRTEIRFGLRDYYQNDSKMDGPERIAKSQREVAKLDGVTTHRFRVQSGDDASCLNLYQASRPRLFGVPDSIIERGGFSFAATLAERDNPWKQLGSHAERGNQDERGNQAEPVPCIVEQNTAMWMLKKGLGDTFDVRDQDNRPIKLKIVATLKDSVFQSEVLIADAAFRKHFPRTEGFGFFLIDVPENRTAEVSKVLTDGLSAYGFETTPSKERVAAYLAVQNTYLTTFQLLGGFGLLLGVLGLAVVLLRSIWERRSELALLRAMGYRSRALNGIVLAENGLLLVVGLLAGVLAALAAVAPHLSAGGHIPWTRLGLMLGGALVVGLAVALIAVQTTLRAPLIPALRQE
jgi:putative ABC transport system permease protein